MQNTPPDCSFLPEKSVLERSHCSSSKTLYCLNSPLLEADLIGVNRTIHDDEKCDLSYWFMNSGLTIS